jgi:hypothetical protein
MTSKDCAVFVLTDSTRAAEISDEVAATWFGDSEYHFTVSESTPKTLPVDLYDQVEASRNKVGEGASVLVVYPWAAQATESTLPERARNGKIPS